MTDQKAVDLAHRIIPGADPPTPRILETPPPDAHEVTQPLTAEARVVPAYQQGNERTLDPLTYADSRPTRLEDVEQARLEATAHDAWLSEKPSAAELQRLRIAALDPAAVVRSIAMRPARDLAAVAAELRPRAVLMRVVIASLQQQSK